MVSKIFFTKEGSKEVLKTITLFDRETGKGNKTQLKYFNAIFNDDLTLKDVAYNEYHYWGGFRSAKSYSQQTAIFLLCRRYPKLKCLIIRDTYDQLTDSVIKQFNDDYEELGSFEYKKADREAVFKNGSTIKFRAFDRDTNILSTEYDVIGICQAEDIPFELYLQCKGRLSGRILPRPLLFLEGNPASGWVKINYKDKQLAGMLPANVFFIEGKTEDNKDHLPVNYIENLRESYPEFWFRRYVLGEWSNLDEMVFSEFREELIVEPIRPSDIKGWKRLIGMDYGWRAPSAMVWGAIDWDGNLIIYDEFEEAQKTPQELAEINLRHGRLKTICDYSIKRPDRDGRSLWDDLLKQGMILIESNKQELENITLANTLMKQGRLKICKNCVNLIREIRNYKWKKLKLGDNRPIPEEPVQVDNHCIDSLIYLLAYLEELKVKDPVKIAFEKSLAYATQKQTKRSKSWINNG